MGNWFTRFPTILQACESIIEMLRGQYAHSVGCFDEAAFHFVEAAKVHSRSLAFKIFNPWNFDRHGRLQVYCRYD